MKPHRLWLFKTFIVLCFFVSTMDLTSALSVAPSDSSDRVRLPSRNQLHLVTQRECWPRVGPFVTQNTAWQRLQEAKREGYGVSGVFPCYDESGTRGYCFNVFYPC
jgi:hypothetical protein